MARRGKKVYEQTERLGFRFKVPEWRIMIGAEGRPLRLC